ncbi:very long-chain specific acyl-CoA dehydrogenase, mitochondrial-like [Macrotis lagotis]|uniref:very long-chain specific acyl-CoA dehydrogenase, mitochondrial-like n=1 Tax=Macrotis lagotis TaxID=92651 RepID=UPI003D6810DB
MPGLAQIQAGPGTGKGGGEENGGKEVVVVTWFLRVDFLNHHNPWVKPYIPACCTPEFGKQICKYRIIQEKLACMAMYHYVTESMAYMISRNMGMDVLEFHLEVAISQISASEAAWEVTHECIQILGGTGYMKGRYARQGVHLCVRR